MAGFSSVTGLESFVWADNFSVDGTARGGGFSLDGQLFIGATALPHIRVNTLTAGTGVTITNGAGTISIAASGTGNVVWQTISASQALAAGNGYMCIAPGGALVLTLPATPTIGDTIKVTLDGATSFQIDPDGTDLIVMADKITSNGGTITTTSIGDTLELVAQSASRWNVISYIGNLTVT